MSKESIAETAIQIVHEHLKGVIRGVPSQDPYRSDWFKLCRSAWENDLREEASSIYLSAESIVEIAKTRWVDQGNPELDDNQRRILDQLYFNWNAWCYAFDRLE